MKTIHRTLQRLALAALAAAAFLSQAEAGPVISVSPATQNISVGDPASINIIVSGLTQAIGGFALHLNFNNTFLSGVSYVNNPGNVMGALPLDMSGGFSGGTSSPLDLFYLADGSISEAALAAAEGASFTLATVSFKGLADGLSPLTLSAQGLAGYLSDYSGFDIAGVTTVNGEICVAAIGATCAINPVPEPATMLLVATGLGALAMRRRRKA